MLHTVLTLVVRLAPLIAIGLVTVALFPSDADGTKVWGELVREHAGPGLLGLILVGVVSGYMSTIDTYLNFVVSLLINDLYRRHLRPQASERELVWFGRVATALVAGVAFLWAFGIMDRIDADWLNFINTVIGLFMLPLTLLRWVWWRLNIWGELVGFVGSFPLGYAVWFVLDFKSEPYWMAFAVLFFSGWGLILSVTFLTRPESADVLQSFYERVRPPGWWGRFARGGDRDAEARSLDLRSAAAGVPFCMAIVGGMCAAFAFEWALTAGCGVVAAISGAWFARAVAQAEAVRRG